MKGYKRQKSWDNLPHKTKKEVLAHMEVYLDNFIGVVQGGPSE